MQTSDLTRRAVLAAAAILAPGAAAFGAAATPVVTVFGDSLTAGYGLRAEQALPAQLQAVLNQRGVAAIIRGAGVNGDTTASALARLDRAVGPDTDLCLVALGGNDLLRVTELRSVRANLDQIISRLKGKGVRVVLAGVGAPLELGRYAQDFNALYRDLAREHRVALYPDLLAGVFLNPALIQPDYIHPNARGVALIAERLAPMVEDSLKGLR